MTELKTVFRSIRLTPSASDLIEKSDDIFKKYSINNGNLTTAFFERACHDHNKFELLVRFYTLLGMKNKNGELLSNEMIITIVREIINNGR